MGRPFHPCRTHILRRIERKRKTPAGARRILGKSKLTHLWRYDMYMCMRTTVVLDDRLFRRAKASAAAAGLTLTSLIEDALREKLHRPRPAAARSLPLPTFRGKGVQPGVNLDSHAELLDRMEQP